MRKINISLLLLTSIISVSCSGPAGKRENEKETLKAEYKEIEKANWFIGKWQNSSAEGNATETWEKLNDSTFTGESYFVVGKDTVSAEKLMLIESNGKLYYIPTVSNQNNAQPVKFALTNSDGNQLIFENPEHDFPQKISYTKLSNDSMVATISGIMDGKENTQQFPMKRVK